MSNQALLPCPFCGSNDLITSLGPAAHDDGSEIVMCNQCESAAHSKTWNTRAMAVPDGYSLVPLDTLARWEGDLDQISGAGHISDELIVMLAAAAAPKGERQ
jgi:hypothetical protein